MSKFSEKPYLKYLSFFIFYESLFILIILIINVRYILFSYNIVSEVSVPRTLLENYRRNWVWVGRVAGTRARPTTSPKRNTWNSSTPLAATRRLVQFSGGLTTHVSINPGLEVMEWN